MNITFHSAGHDFGATVIPVRVLDKAGNEQRLAHHAAHQWALGILHHIVSDDIFVRLF
jgi:hypothetical protein